MSIGHKTPAPAGESPGLLGQTAWDEPHNIVETGGTTLDVGAIADNEFLRRSGSNIVGDPGTAGPTGPTGPDGATGAQGTTGVQGATGPSGPSGPQGPQGTTGATGPTGIQGITGPSGPSGPQGPAGATGPTGASGPTGSDAGFTGPTGPAGSTGAQGTTGPSGPTGTQGTTGSTGPSGPSGPQGPTGVGITGPTGPAGGGGPSARSVVALLTGATSVVASAAATSPSLLFAVTTGNHMFQFRIPWQTGALTVGLRIGMMFPAFSTLNIAVRGAIAADGTAGEFQGQIDTSGDFVVFTAAATLRNNYCHIDGSAAFTAAGTMHIIYGAEIASSLGVALSPGACGIMWAMQ